MRIIPIYYHLVSNEQNPLVENLYTFKDVASFKRDIEALVNRYKILDLADLKAQQKGVVLSFDDGFAECYHTIFPILKQFGIPAFFFINNDFLDNKSMFYRAKISLIISHLIYSSTVIHKQIADLLGCKITEIKKKLLAIKNGDSELLDSLLTIMKIDIAEYLSKHQPYLTSEQIREMIKANCYFGGHTRDHMSLKNMPSAEQEFRIVDSAKDIAARFDLDYTLCSLPHNDAGISREVLHNASKEVDYIFGGYGFRQDLENNYYQRVSNEHSTMRIDKFIKMWKIFHKSTNRIRIIKNVLKRNQR